MERTNRGTGTHGGQGRACASRRLRPGLWSGSGPARRLRKERAMGRLDGKVAIVTGAARGTGSFVARRFAAEGARVAVADVLDDLGKAVADELGEGGRFVHLDVTDEAGWNAAVASLVAGG